MARQTRDEVFAEIAMALKLMTREQVDECLRVRNQLTGMGLSKRTLGQIAVERKFVTPRQVKHIHKEMIKRGFHPRIAGYEVLEQVGAGGMGVVCKARQISLDRIVAIKLLPPHLARDRAYVARFRREAKLAAKVSHPNAVHVYDVGEEAGKHYIVMEFVDGVPLDNMLQKGPLAETQALQILRDVGRALEKAHEAGIIHRDIKPGNILMTPDGTPKLSDLGLAKQVGGSSGVSLTVTGSVSGTPHYMSPEQCRGDKNLDQRSDIYSFGITFYKMVCGREPFAGDTPVTIMHKHLEEPLPDPLEANPELLPATAQLVRDMTAKDPNDRIQTCAEVVRRVCAILGTSPSMPGVQAAAPGPSTSTAPTLRMSDTPTMPARLVRAGKKAMTKIVIIGAVVVAVAVLLGAGFVLRDRWGSQKGGAGAGSGAANTVETTTPPKTPDVAFPDDTGPRDDVPRAVDDVLRDMLRQMKEQADPQADLIKIRDIMEEAHVVHPAEGTSKLILRAYVEGTSVLLLYRGRAQWLNMDGTVPGKGNTENNPTYINNKEWTPVWREKDPVPKGRAFSEPFFIPDLLPALLPLTGRLLESKGVGEPDKAPVLITNRGGAVAIVFINATGTASWFTATVEVEWTRAPKEETPSGERPGGRWPRPWGGKRTPPTKP